MSGPNDTPEEVERAAIKEVALLGIGDETDVAYAHRYRSEHDGDAITAVCVDVMQRALKAEAANREKDAEIANLRKYLIQIGRDAGCLMTDEVSSFFLQYLPQEIRLKLASLRASVAGEKPEDAWKRGEQMMLNRVNSLLYEAGEGLNLASMKYVALPTEKES